MSVTPTHPAAASRGAISLESNLDKGVKLHRQTARPSTATSRLRSAAPQIAHPLPVLLLALVWVAVIAWGVTQRRLPAWTVAGAIALNLVTFFFYAHDKNAAQPRRWRVSENTLHLLGLLGGWPFAWVAQQMLRHKSRKAAFRMTYWVTVTAHFAGLLAVVFLPQFRLTIG